MTLFCKDAIVDDMELPLLLEPVALLPPRMNVVRGLLRRLA